MIIRCAVEDHPRVCGKNKVAVTTTDRSLGSPPRVREKLTIIDPLEAGAGITPACAGKTFLFGRRLVLSGDHPRVCGKNKNFLTSSIKSVGSPPRVREKLANLSFCLFRPWITPACAGKTDMSKLSVNDRRDHPRVCGKNTKRSY